MERSENVALAAQVFDQFCNAGTLKAILALHRHLCDLLQIRPTNFNQFYPKLKAKLGSWRAQALWSKFDKRASHKCYNRNKCGTNLRVLVIGAGPCGLRTAIEAQLLGAKVVVIEKRDRITRNNVLHLWPFVIHDLRALGAKKFFGRFCAGAIDHISIRQLQCILLKVALILGVEVHEAVGFEKLLPPPDVQGEERVGWRAQTSPPDHPASQYEFDVLIGADGKRNTLDGFKRKEFRGKLAIAITANFINRHTEAEARVEEISGVAFIFNQKFFKDLYASTGIDLENIVYYKDDTHYFVMTAKKHSLIDKGVILSDQSDAAKLLSTDNVDKKALLEYAREAADFSTGCRLPQLEFAVNHYGQPDVAMFDFTSMYAAENATHFIEKRGHRLMVALVGDSLLEPFWPTGSGCARGFLSCMDTCWAIRSWGLGLHPLEVIAERESIYRLLAQTTPENLQRDLQSYTLDPHTRYPNLNSRSLLPLQVRSLFETDDISAVEQFLKEPRNRADTRAVTDTPKKRKRKEGLVHPDTLLYWLQKQVALYNTVKLLDMTSSFKDGMALCAIIHRYRPHLVDFNSLNKEDISKNNQLAFDILEKEFAIPPVMTGDEMAECEIPDKLAMLSYLSQVYEAFRGEIPHIKHPKLEENEENVEEVVKLHSTRMKSLAHMTSQQKVNLLAKATHRPPRRRRSHLSTTESIEERLKKLEALEEEANCLKRDFEPVIGGTQFTERQERIRELERERRHRQRRQEEIERNRNDRYMRRKYLRHLANQQFYKSMQMLQSNQRPDDESGPFEDYSLFVYRMTAPDFKDRVKQLEDKLLYPDRENRSMDYSQKGSSTDKEFSGRVKDLEAKLRGVHSDKKPKDLLRAIGKIEKGDWNVKQIEQKIEENRMGRGGGKKYEKVPKWSKQQFEDKVSAVERKLKAKSNKIDFDNKYSELDNNMMKIGRKIKEGIYLEQGQRGANKVSAMAAHLATIHRQPEPAVTHVSKSSSGIVLPTQGASEMCHFCNKRVYLMERLNAEGKFFHRGCFRCQYCSTSLRLGNYAFDREGKFGYKFYCVQHFGLQGTTKRSATREEFKQQPTSKKPPVVPIQTKEEQPIDDISTPERAEFENLSDCVEVEEDEWTDRNFGLSTTDVSDTSADSDSSSDENDGFAEAEDGGLDPEETLRLVKDWTRRYAYSSDSQDESETEMEDDGDLKKSDQLDDDSESGSETEVQSDDYSSVSSAGDNSATEISTDSEFEHDGTTHTIPDIVISETVQVKRGNIEQPKQVQIVTRQLNGKIQTTNNDLKQNATRETKPALNNLVNNNRPSPLINPNRGDYLLNRTQSTEGIASKISLELKKKYLLGPTGLSGSVKKSGSATTLDTRFKSLIDQISEQQKLLNPAPAPSPTMQAFLQGADKLKTSPVHLLEKKQLPSDNFKHICSLKENEDRKDDKKEDDQSGTRSPVHETSIVVPEFPRTEVTKEVESDSLSSDLSSSTEDSADEQPIQSPPKLEIHNSRGELMEDTPEMDSLNMPDICLAGNDPSPIDKLDLVPLEFKKVITVPTDTAGGEVLTQVPNTAELYADKEDSRPNSPDSTDSLKNDVTAMTETEFSDWARDEDGVSEPLDDMEFINPQYQKQAAVPRGIAKIAKTEDFDEYTHVCGKDSPLNLDNLEFMDTGEESSDESSTNNKLLLNKGYVQFVNNEDDLTPVIEAVNPLKEELTDTTTTTSEVTTIKDSPADKDFDYVPFQSNKKPFVNLRDSIDIMKMREPEPKGNSLNSPATSRKLEQLSQERAKQKDLIHEMVMNKLLAQGKSPQERKKRVRNFSPHSAPPLEHTTPILETKKLEESPKTPLAVSTPKTPINQIFRPRQRANTVGNGWRTEMRIPEASSLPDIHNACTGFKTPLTIPNLRSGLREQARAKFKMMSDEELGLSPEDKLRKFKLKIQKHLPDTPKSSQTNEKMSSLKKTKDDRKKSIIQAVSDFFHKKSPSPPKTPSSQSPTTHFNINLRRDKQSDAPPVPPPPQSYMPSQEDSFSEEETHSGDNTSLIKKQRISRRIARQAQSKRLRMAQEVQRQLEELEVKQKELEAQGVAVEKALRGEETAGVTGSESELLGEWLRLTRERSEARSKEKMLVIRGQEIELEHRHARLQAQLTSLMDQNHDGKKTSEEVALEGRILREMLEIAERKNSLQLQLQAETQRFQEEDRDLEAKMKAKGLQLPLKQ
ncbi:F-actin-monooxygenase Mical isoform X1 [Cimex lectularius]|uniref:F-actin monooxygenase n=1 Tax=Cimex lectularius TaxID=79782 RepID=A0A8I6SIC7_CIMLE|nr:F-actin-monooxygenase Mical isoform X1 [Cimex lectularius]XP_014262545.1 F-actin-monooxygenase Mical isoform X1 [Cimex lectularius]XP_014262553.1 F-actin-monooxygenase Mical isoform X1 [Cimex lectularius]XP_014262562.1 F-actin-monooxygenase Mical isoform X1 [Cimex lectularius]XP_024083849.1 F-actin-monooxygenase Mical isoform X1 [Cimex lectularius]